MVETACCLLLITGYDGLRNAAAVDCGLLVPRWMPAAFYVVTGRFE